MKKLHPLSFGFGLIAGLLVFVLLFGSMRLLRGATATPYGERMRSEGRQNGTGMQNLSRMAERLGMTEAELDAELKSGKTFQGIAAERGVVLGRNGPGFTRTGSGALNTTASGATESSGRSSSLPL